MALVQHELSEPYVIYTYRYFLQQWCAPLPTSLAYLAHMIPLSLLSSRLRRPHLAFLVSSHRCRRANHADLDASCCSPGLSESVV